MKTHEPLQAPAVKGLYGPKNDPNQGCLHAVSLPAPELAARSVLALA